MAEGILKEKLKQLAIPAEVDSCGFESFHVGEHPDARAVEISRRHGIDISGHTARLFSTRDFQNFDLILVMDTTHYYKIMKLVPDEKNKAKVDFVMNAVFPGSNKAVPDPWYDDISAFEEVFSLLDFATDRIAGKIASQFQTP